MTLSDQLNPSKVKVSDKFTAVLAYILDEKWTDPTIIGLTVLGDGLVMIAHDDDPFDNHILGHKSDLIRNLRGVAEAVDMTPEDTRLLLLAAESHLRYGA